MSRLACIAFLWCFCVHIHARSFYVNARSGSDGNSGLSPREAWKTLRQVNITTFAPGDTILFRAGQTWEGMLFPQGSGKPGLPIVITKYGGLEKPKIHGGHADPCEFEGIRSIQTVLLYNRQHWVISNLEITNMPDNIIEDFNDNGYERRRGIYVVASDTGELQGIVIRNNYIHHVKGDDTKDFHGSGGIMLAVLGRRRPSSFNGVYILRNRIRMVNRTGIGLSSRWQRRPGQGYFPDSWMDEMGPYRANLNVVIRGNDLESIGGDGIVPQTSFKALMEYNRVNGAAARSKSYNAGLWAWNSDSVLIQYNEVCNTHTTRDGMAFDCDAYSAGNIYQYNYSHNNEGGFLLLHGASTDAPGGRNEGHIIRHNISMNDGNALLHVYGSGHTRTTIHRNLFFNIAAGVRPVSIEGEPADISICDNIFYIPHMTKWQGIRAFDRFHLTGNTFPETCAGNVPERGKNIIRTPTFRELCILLNCRRINNPAGDAVNPKNIRLLWQLMLQHTRPES